jgi:DNA segregation ATPase FtsK/SpoIIIE, S-DNA-T family
VKQPMKKSTRRQMESAAAMPRLAVLKTEVEAAEVGQVLQDLGVPAEDIVLEPGLRLSLAHLRLGSSTRIRELRSLREDLALRLGVDSVQVRTGLREGCVTLEIPHQGGGSAVGMGDVFEYDPTHPDCIIPSFIGKDMPWAVGLHADGQPMVVDLCDASHVLIGGQTGSGKSSHLQSIMTGLVLANGTEGHDLYLVDPRRVDLVPFERLRNVQGFATDQAQALEIVETLLEEVEFRFEEFQRAGVHDLLTYNAWVKTKKREKRMRWVLLVIDELAMVLSGKEGKELGQRLTLLSQICRAAGVIIVAATQRPSAVSLPTELRSELTTRVVCQVATAADSRMILDAPGAEKLMGAGDTLIRWGGGEPMRVQGTYVSTAWRDTVVQD